jgi:hypothetical protein
MFFLTALQAYIEQVWKIRRCSDFARRTPLVISNETLLHDNKHWSLDQIEIVICKKTITLATFRGGRRHDNHHMYLCTKLSYQMQVLEALRIIPLVDDACIESFQWQEFLKKSSSQLRTSAWACSLCVCPSLCFVTLLFCPASVIDRTKHTYPIARNKPFQSIGKQKTMINFASNICSCFLHR